MQASKPEKDHLTGFAEVPFAEVPEEALEFMQNSLAKRMKAAHGPDVSVPLLNAESARFWHSETMQCFSFTTMINGEEYGATRQGRANPPASEYPDFREMSDPDIVNTCKDRADYWAAAYCQTAKKRGETPPDFMMLVGWFANAIETADVHRHPTVTPDALLPPVEEANGPDPTVLNVLRADANGLEQAMRNQAMGGQNLAIRVAQPLMLIATLRRAIAEIERLLKLQSSVSKH